MQTFLPYADFAASAATLDRQRLGKQRVEGLQILNTLLSDAPRAGWRNHPAVKAWRGFEGALAQYTAAICQEWRGRGYKDTVEEKVLALVGERALDLPPWIGDERVHLSHRANLVRKDPAWYGPRFPGVDPTMPYVWPVP